MEWKKIDPKECINKQQWLRKSADKKAKQINQPLKKCNVWKWRLWIAAVHEIDVILALNKDQFPEQSFEHCCLLFSHTVTRYYTISW